MNLYQVFEVSLAKLPVSVAVPATTGLQDASGIIERIVLLTCCRTRVRRRGNIPSIPRIIGLTNSRWRRESAGENESETFNRSESYRQSQTQPLVDVHSRMRTHAALLAPIPPTEI